MQMLIQNGFMKAIRAAAVGLLLTAAGAAAQAAELRVSPDGNALLTLAKAPTTVIIGNPLYADAAILENRVLVQGRNPGRTRIQVLDEEGKLLANLDVKVEPVPQDTLRVYKRGDRYTYTCMPECTRVLVANDKDSSDMAEKLLETIETARKAAGK